MKYLAGFSCALLAAGCAASSEDLAGSESDPAATDPASQADPAQTDVAPTDETSARRQAALPQPYVTTGGGSTATVTNGLAGTSVAIDGATAVAAYALVNFPVATNAMAVDAEFTVNPARGAAFQYLLTGSGGGYASRQIRLERAPGSETLTAAATTGIFACGALPSGQATAVTVSFDGTAKTYDVLIAGHATPCTNLPTRVAGPVTGFRVTDPANEGYGGRVDFADLALVY